MILFSHTKDFTPFFNAEFIAVAQLKEEWKIWQTKVIGLSVDGVHENKKWKQDIEPYGNNKPDFPIIANTNLPISKVFDMLPPEACLPYLRTVNLEKWSCWTDSEQACSLALDMNAIQDWLCLLN